MVGGARLVSLSHSELGQVYIRLGSKQEVEEELGEDDGVGSETIPKIKEAGGSTKISACKMVRKKDNK